MPHDVNPNNDTLRRRSFKTRADAKLFVIGLLEQHSCPNIMLVSAKNGRHVVTWTRR
jgi:presenilin-like A22 family membrane protease